MKIPFYKYQGTGNDFVMIDNRHQIFPKNNTKLISQMCDRRFGIGGDGLILLEDHEHLDFEMVYYNSDGNLSSMCGNGGRCVAQFAKKLELINKKAHFYAIDGEHTAFIKGNKVSLKMQDVGSITEYENHVFLDTGSPHHVQMVENIENVDVNSEGRKIRNDIYGLKGANVNFVQPISTDKFSVRTYERGVENETLSCGTGVTAVALAMDKLGKTNFNEIILVTPGGELLVKFTKDTSGYTDIFLEGDARMVYKGVWS